MLGVGVCELELELFKKKIESEGRESGGGC